FCTINGDATWRTNNTNLIELPALRGMSIEGKLRNADELLQLLSMPAIESLRLAGNINISLLDEPLRRFPTLKQLCLQLPRLSFLPLSLGTILEVIPALETLELNFRQNIPKHSEESLIKENLGRILKSIILRPNACRELKLISFGVVFNFE